MEYFRLRRGISKDAGPFNARRIADFEKSEKGLQTILAAVGAFADCYGLSGKEVCELIGAAWAEEVIIKIVTQPPEDLGKDLETAIQPLEWLSIQPEAREWFVHVVHGGDELSDEDLPDEDLSDEDLSDEGLSDEDLPYEGVPDEGLPKKYFPREYQPSAEALAGKRTRSEPRDPEVAFYNFFEEHSWIVEPTQAGLLRKWLCRAGPLTVARAVQTPRILQNAVDLLLSWARLANVAGHKKRIAAQLKVLKGTSNPVVTRHVAHALAISGSRKTLCEYIASTNDKVDDSEPNLLYLSRRTSDRDNGVQTLRFLHYWIKVAVARRLGILVALHLRTIQQLIASTSSSPRTWSSALDNVALTTSLECLIRFEKGPLNLRHKCPDEQCRRTADKAALMIQDAISKFRDAVKDAPA